VQQHIHPISATPIEGMSITAGAVLRKTDVYDSTTGKWEPVPPALVGSTLQKGHGAFFIRPNTELSDDGKAFLANLVWGNLLLTYRNWWIVIPSLEWKYDGRMDWQVLCPDCIPELVSYGYVEPHPDDPAVYQLTDKGRSTGKALLTN